jgi:CRISPR-associated endonuclease/helicase Cas3
MSLVSSFAAETLLAHSINTDGVQQQLVKHLENVASLAQEFGQVISEENAACVSGLLHDLGKAKTSWQTRLEMLQRGEEPAFSQVLHDHKFTSAVYAWTQGMQDIAQVIAGHHGGMINLPELRQIVEQGQYNEGARESALKLSNFLANVGRAALSKADFYRMVMLFSCLCDGDCIDTSDHFGVRLHVAKPESLVELYSVLATHNVQSTTNVSDRILKLRHDVRNASVDAQALPKGFFQLHSVTGSGKTISGGLFALGHAVHHGLRRIVYVAPFRSIIDQTAAVYKSILGEESVLAHHSTADFWTERNEYQAQVQKQLAENWEVPVVVTTAEQFFESLYSSRPAASRKLHNIAHGVVIIDEVQALPLRLLTPCFAVLKKLVEEYGCTVLFTTATMPPLCNEALLGKVKITNILRQKHTDHRRVRIFKERFKGAYWFQVAEFMSTAKQALLIANTRDNAFTVYKDLPVSSRMYLSTWMCPTHRVQVIEQVRQRLQSGEPCHLASTQVIEAGVDFDFPDLMLREKAPLDSMLQAFGRCNRNGKGKGHCYIVSPAAGNKLADYEQGIAVVNKLIFEQKLNPHDRKTMEKYYSLLYQEKNLDTERVMANVAKLNFRDIREGTENTHGFRLILENQIHVIVKFGTPEQKAKLQEAITAIEKGVAEKQKPGDYKWAVRHLQKYVVSLHEHSFKRLQQVFPFGLKPLLLNYWLWLGEYSTAVGLGNVMESLRR